MKQFNYFDAFYRSFYSRALYRDVVEYWGAGVVLYLLMVLAITSAINMIGIQRSVDRGYEKLAEEYVPQLPHMTIKDGVASTPENHPYMIRNPENDELTIVIDTTGKIVNLDQSHSKILVTQHEVMIKDSDRQVRIEKFPKTLNLDLEPAQVNKMLESYIEYSWVLIFPALLFFALVYRLIQALVYAFIGKFFSLMSRASLTYVNSLKLSMVAITPAIVIETILSLFEVQFPLQLLFYLVLALGYLMFAVAANKNDKL